MQQAMKLALTAARAGVKTGQEMGLSDRQMLMAFAMLRRARWCKSITGAGAWNVR